MMFGSTPVKVTRKARIQRQEAIREARRATAMTDLQTVFAGDSRDPDGRPLSAAGRIAIAEKVVVSRYGSEPWLVSGLLADLASRHYESGNPGAEREMLGRARAIAIEAKAYDQLALAVCRRALGFWLEDKLDSARTDVEEAKSVLARQGRRDPSVEVVCLEAEGKLLQATGSPDSGVALLQRAVAIAGDTPGGSQLLGVTNSLAEVLRLSGRTREAVPYFRRILAELDAAGYGETEAYPNVVGFLAASLWDLGEIAALDSTLGAMIREREAIHGAGRVPSPLAFHYGRAKLRLGALDSADLWIGRAVRDTTPALNNFHPYADAAVAELRLEQGRLAEARVAVSRLPDGRRGQRATAAMLRARLRWADGDSADAAALLEREMGVLLGDGQPGLTLFALPLITAGEWRLARGDAAGADSLARLARREAAIDSVALKRSVLAGRAGLLLARALEQQGRQGEARAAAADAVAALSNGYGRDNRWTREAAKAPLIP